MDQGLCWYKCKKRVKKTNRKEKSENVFPSIVESDERERDVCLQGSTFLFLDLASHGHWHLFRIRRQPIMTWDENAFLDVIFHPLFPKQAYIEDCWMAWNRIWWTEIEILCQLFRLKVSVIFVPVVQELLQPHFGMMPKMKLQTPIFRDT